MVTLTKRSDVPKEYTWDLESIFPTNEEWEQRYKSIAGRLPELESLQRTLSQSGQALLNVLQQRDEVFEQLETLFVYASMRKDEDTTNSLYQGMYDRAMQLLVRAASARMCALPRWKRCWPPPARFPKVPTPYSL